MEQANREKAIAWFNSKNDHQKSILCEKYYSELIGFNSQCVTGSMIEKMWLREGLLKEISSDSPKTSH